MFNVDLPREAYRRPRKGGAPWIDKVMAKEYAEELESNLSHLFERLRLGTYKAPFIERVCFFRLMFNNYREMEKSVDKS